MKHIGSELVQGSYRACKGVNSRLARHPKIGREHIQMHIICSMHTKLCKTLIFKGKPNSNCYSLDKVYPPVQDIWSWFWAGFHPKNRKLRFHFSQLGQPTRMVYLYLPVTKSIYGPWIDRGGPQLLPFFYFWNRTITKGHMAKDLGAKSFLPLSWKSPT